MDTSCATMVSSGSGAVGAAAAAGAAPAAGCASSSGCSCSSGCKGDEARWHSRLADEWQGCAAPLHHGHARARGYQMKHAQRSATCKAGAARTCGPPPRRCSRSSWSGTSTSTYRELRSRGGVGGEDEGRVRGCQPFPPRLAGTGACPCSASWPPLSVASNVPGSGGQQAAYSPPWAHLHLLGRPVWGDVVAPQLHQQVGREAAKPHALRRLRWEGGHTG